MIDGVKPVEVTQVAAHSFNAAFPDAPVSKLLAGNPSRPGDVDGFVLRRNPWSGAVYPDISSPISAVRIAQMAVFVEREAALRASVEAIAPFHPKPALDQRPLDTAA